MDPAREPRDPVPEGQPGAAGDRTDATREPAREPRPATPPRQPGAAGDRTDATRAPTGQHRVVFEVLAEAPPKPIKRIEFAIDGRAAEEEEAQRMSMREWFAGAGDDVLTYDQVMARLPPPLPRDDAAAQAYAAADVDAGAPPRVWAGVGAEACSPCRAPHAEAVDLGSPAPSPRVEDVPARREVHIARMPEPDVETLEASMRALRAEIERRERRRGKRPPPRPGARRIFGDVKNRVA